MSQEQPPIHGPHSVTMPDVFGAVREYVVTWALPPLERERVYRGWRHNVPLPPGLSEGGDDFAVITVLADNRHGTNVSNMAWDAATREDAVLTRSKLVRCDVLVEFYGDADRSHRRACAVETLMRDEAACMFFKPHGLTPLYADGTREITPEEDVPHARARYATTLHVSYWLHLSARVGWFDTVNVDVFANVDTHYPTEE